MKRRSAILVCTALASTIGALAVAACVGDDPPVSSPATDDGAVPGADGSTNPGADGASPGTDASTNDGASSMDASDGAVPFEVTQLPGVRLWLESTKNLVASGGTGFGSWRDSAGYWDGGAAPGAPDGGFHVALPNASNVTAAEIVTNGINGRPTVSFIDGNGYLRLDNHDDFTFGTGDFLIAEVAKVSSGSGTLWNLRPQATAGSEESFAPGFLCVAFGMGVTNGCTTPVYTPTTEPHVYVARRVSSIFTVRVDTSPRSTLDVMGAPTNIGVNQFTQPSVFIGAALTAQISEVVVIVGPTSDANLAKLENHLKTKYAIP